MLGYIILSKEDFPIHAIAIHYSLRSVKMNLGYIHLLYTLEFTFKRHLFKLFKEFQMSIGSSGGYIYDKKSQGGYVIY